MAKKGRPNLRDAAPKEKARRKRRSVGSGAGPVVDGVPVEWRKTWREPKKRLLRESQLAGFTRAETLGELRRVIECRRGIDEDNVLKAIEINNKVQGFNEPEKCDVQVSGDFWSFAERGERDKRDPRDESVLGGVA